MKRWSKFAPLLTLFTAATALAQTNAPVVGPVPRTDRNSQIAHEQLLAKARQGGIDLYFVGDSIIRRWGCSDAAYRDLLANWTTNFHGWNAGNFGWGSDTVQNILWRLENGELAGVRPRSSCCSWARTTSNPATPVKRAKPVSPKSAPASGRSLIRSGARLRTRR